MPAPLALRRTLSALLLPVRSRIRAGPNEGCRWSLASGRYLGGTMEEARMELVGHLLGDGDVCWDVGAHHGYVALHASRCVGPRGAVYAFEPSPYNLTYLRKHVEWNDRDNLDLLPVALAARDGTALLAETGSSRSFGFGSEGVPVRTVSFSTLLKDHGLRLPSLLKIDVEGAEGEVVESSAPYLPPSSVALVAIHSHANYTRVRAGLEAVGFTVMDSAGARHLKGVESGKWSSDPDVLAYGSEATAPDRRILELLEKI